MRQSQAGKRITIALWTPKPFWSGALRTAGSAPGAVSQVVAPFDTYAVFLVAQGDQEGVGMDFASEQDIRASLELIAADGTRHKPLAWDAVSPDLVQVLGMLKPAMATFGGPFGENLHPYVFAGANGEARRTADPFGKGRVALVVRGTELSWRLPIGALLARRKCPETGDMFSGAYRFCPYHGVALVPE